MKNISTSKQKQGGAILVVALMFLVAITLFTISSMRSSNIGLFMAQNEESRIAAEQAAQALADAIVASPASTPVVGTTGYTACTAGEKGCNRNDLPVTNPILASAVANDYIQARVERTGTIFRPPPRVVETSIDKFSSASFLGHEQVTEGVLVLVPKQ